MSKMTAPAGFLPNLEVRVIAFSLRDERLHVWPALEGSLWALPGSRVEAQRSLEEAASGRLYCLTGLRETYLEQLYTFGEPERHSIGRPVSVVYFALVPAAFQTNPGETTPPIDMDAEGAKWFPVEALPDLTGDHPEILAHALRRLRYKLEYSAVGFQLLPEKLQPERAAADV